MTKSKTLVRKMKLVLLALLATGTMQAHATDPMPALKSSVYAKAGGWTITRYADASKKTAFCETIRIVASEKALRFTSDKKAFTMAFMGNASAVVDGEIPVSVWFDGDKKSGFQEQFSLSIDGEQTYWRTLTEPNDEPGGVSDSAMNRSSVSFGYNFENERITETFALTGTNAALKKLFECGLN